MGGGERGAAGSGQAAEGLNVPAAAAGGAGSREPPHGLGYRQTRGGRRVGITHPRAPPTPRAPATRPVPRPGSQCAWRCHGGCGVVVAVARGATRPLGEVLWTGGVRKLWWLPCPHSVVPMVVPSTGGLWQGGVAVAPGLWHGVGQRRGCSVAASAGGGRVLGRARRPTGTSPRDGACHPTLPPPPRGAGAAAVLPAVGCLHRPGCPPSPLPMSGGAEGAAPLPQLNAVSTGHRHRSGDNGVLGCPQCRRACPARCQGERVSVCLAVPMVRACHGGERVG